MEHQSEASHKHIRQNMRKVVQGQCGKFLIQKRLAKLSQDQFAVINNYPIYERTKQAQMDHLVLSAQRVYVIETKTYSGKITGQKNGSWWTQRSSHKIVHFRNPFIQNRNHILYLRSIFECECGVCEYSGVLQSPISCENPIRHRNSCRKNSKDHSTI